MDNKKLNKKYKNSVYSNEKSMAKSEMNRKDLMRGASDSRQSMTLGSKLKRLKMAKRMLKYGKSVITSKVSLRDNPQNPKETATKEFIEEFEQYAYSLGVSDMGYIKVVPELVFKDKVGLYSNAIVLTLEMDKEKIKKAPSSETHTMIHNTYSNLDDIMHKLASFLRKNGFGAQVSLSRGGIAHYPLLVQSAGLGYRGKHGLIVTPKLGPRQRASVIFTSIDNFPVCTENPHKWIKEFCKTCGNCVRQCPTGAILTEEIRDENGYLKHLDLNKCMHAFANNHGCSICVKTCIFNNVPYETLRKKFLKS